MNKKNLRFVVALKVEAEAILELYNLKENTLQKGNFKTFINDDLNIWLVLSGIGNINSNKATKYLHEQSPKNKKNIWINIGMAGSNNYKIGNIFNIKKVSFMKKSYYTGAIVNHITPSSEVISVDSVEKKFTLKNTLYEMEAYGFIKEVEKICDREQICIIKIVSDNKKNKPINFIRNTKLYINNNLINIEKTIEEYIKNSSSLSNKSKANLELIQRKFNLTYSYRIILNDLLLKFEKIYSKNLLLKTINDSRDIKELIKQLKSKIKVYLLKV